MVEISNDTLLLVLVVLSFGVSAYFAIRSRQLKTVQTEVLEGSKGVKKRAERGQEDAVETLKDLTAESIKFLKDTNNELRSDIKKLKGTVAYYKSQLYGTGEIAPEDLQGKPNGAIKVRPENGVSEDVVQMRLRMIAEKIKIPPELLMFEDVNAALSEIASSPDFDKIAATALKSSSSNEGTSDGKIPGITYV